MKLRVLIAGSCVSGYHKLPRNETLERVGYHARSSFCTLNNNVGASSLFLERVNKIPSAFQHQYGVL